MVLWTIHEIDFWEKLQRDTAIRPDLKSVQSSYDGDLDFFVRPYGWLVGRLEERIGRPGPDAMPIWAWYQYHDSKRRRPDLRQGAHLDRGAKGVRIEFEIDDELVVLSDFDLWHCVLNYWPVFGTEKESDEFEAELDAKGLDFYKQKPLPDMWNARIERTWENIFDLDFICDLTDNAGRSKKCIQANFWELHMDMVRKVDEFVAR